MNATEVTDLVNTVVTDLNAAADYAGIVDPDLIPFIQLGKAVDKMLPGIAGHVASWIEGNPPTEAEKADLAAKLGVLGDPNQP